MYALNDLILLKQCNPNIFVFFLFCTADHNTSNWSGACFLGTDNHTALWNATSGDVCNSANSNFSCCHDRYHIFHYASQVHIFYCGLTTAIHLYSLSQHRNMVDHLYVCISSIIIFTRYLHCIFLGFL